jgi:GMP synthase (glutamine-hydrolysing)
MLLLITFVHVKMILIINFGSSKTSRISECLSASGYDSRIVEWNEFQSPDDYQPTGIILSGAPILLTEEDPSEFIKRFAFLKTIQVPVLGICFGHQLLGLLFEASVFKGEEVRKETAITILNKKKLFTGLENNVKMIEDHTEGITLPSSFIQLASSEKYEIEAMKHSDFEMYGVQFHPEVSGENGLRVLTNFCKLTLAS